MKFKLFILFAFIGISSIFAQTHVADSISGGSYTIIADPAIETLVQKSTKAKCYNAPGSNPAPTTQPDKIDPCAKSQKVLGYKIQIMYTKDRNTASRARAEFAKNFPHLVPEMVYTQPDFRVIAGDYFTKRTAAMDLNAVKRKYPGAFLIQWRVWCRKAK